MVFNIINFFIQVEDDCIGLSVEIFKWVLVDNLFYFQGKFFVIVIKNDCYMVLVYIICDCFL